MSAAALQKPPLDRYGYNAIARHISTAILTSLPLFIAGNDWSWDWAWVYTFASLTGWTLLSFILARENPGLLNQRGRRTKEMLNESKRWDVIILSIYSLMLFVVPVVAGLDHRYGWSGDTPALVNLFGIVLLALGFVALTWSMAANKFFQATVVIQQEQQVADDGPYRYVRHPGYTGVILHFLAVPFAVGAWVALIPALIGVVLFVVRTALEDQTLRKELAGYEAFAQRTRYRLFPGVW